MARTIVWTAATLSLALFGLFEWIVLKFYDDPDRLSAVGQAIGAGVSAIALLWILVSQYTMMLNLRSQSKALALQSQDLALQRQVLFQSEQSIAADIFLQVLNESKQTLGRFARSVIACDPASDLEALDDEFSATADPAVYVRHLAEDAQLEEFVQRNAGDGIITPLVQRYRQHYENLRSLANRSAGGPELFDLSMENSAYQQVLSRF